MTKIGDVKSFTIIYVSETGQAKAISESLYDMASAHHYEAKLFCISNYDQEFKLNEIQAPIVFVCSTTGDGDLPETAFKCWNKLKREKNSDALSNVNYALLGLGDTNYTNFSGGPKSLHKRLEELGAKCFFGPFYADDGTGLELVVEPFKEDVWKALDNFFTKNISMQNVSSIKECEEANLVKALSLLNTELTLPLLPEKCLEIEYLTENTALNSSATNSDEAIQSFMSMHSQVEMFEALVSCNQISTDSSAEKTCHNLKFRLENLCKLNSTGMLTKEEGIEFVYEPGDSISIVCRNEPEEVAGLLQRLGADASDKRILIKSTNVKKIAGKNYAKLTEKYKMTLSYFFTYCVDIRNVCIKKALLRMLSHYCGDKSDETRLLELCSKECSEQFQSLVKETSLSLLDLLNMFASCRPPLDHLIQLLPPLLARSYSLCSFYKPSSGDSVSNELEIVFNLVNFESNQGRTYRRHGVATGYLSGLKSGEKIFFLKKNFQGFTFPQSSEEKPLIMIGPGTGIAPFISYLRHMQYLSANNKSLWLLYGCRDPRKDFLFKKEMCTELHKVLAKFCVTFSRITGLDQIGVEDKELLANFYTPNSKYVQDSLRINAAKLCRLIYEQEAYVYICGDASNMSKDVLNCFAECLAAEYNLTIEEASKYFADMIKAKRYKQDIWS